MQLLTIALVCLSVSFSHADDTEVSTEYDFIGKNVLITGAANGIGLATVKNILKAGAEHVIIVDIDKESGSEVETALNEEYGTGKVDYQYGDVTTDLETIYEYVISTYGYIHVFISNAGICDEYNIRKTYEVNNIANAEWSWKYFNLMRKDQNGNGGTIIMLASQAGYLDSPFIVTYSSSKAGVLGLAYCMGNDYTYRTSGVRTLAICPGLTYTDMTKAQMVTDDQKEIWEKFKASNTWQEADHVGKSIVDVYKTAESGTAWTVQGGEDAFEAPKSELVNAAMLDAL